MYGFSTAVVRAITAIPGHACFGVFMGVFYGIAKRYDNLGKAGTSRLFRVFALVFPMLLHGTYDFIATMEETTGGLYFLGFVTTMFVASYLLVGQTSKQDRYIQ